YAIGACLLDRANPTRLLGRLSFPLIEADSDHWAGFVPNSVYSCGGLVHRDMLYIPYGVADSFATFARVGIAALLGAMTPC
ncbi:MAG: glycosidase, partial [Sphingomonas parapaucimobilis]